MVLPRNHNGNGERTTNEVKSFPQQAKQEIKKRYFTENGTQPEKIRILEKTKDFIAVENASFSLIA